MKFAGLAIIAGAPGTIMKPNWSLIAGSALDARLDVAQRDLGVVRDDAHAARDRLTGAHEAHRQVLGAAGQHAEDDQPGDADVLRAFVHPVVWHRRTNWTVSGRFSHRRALA